MGSVVEPYKRLSAYVLGPLVIKDPRNKPSYPDNPLHTDRHVSMFRAQTHQSQTKAYELYALITTTLQSLVRSSARSRNRRPRGTPKLDLCRPHNISGPDHKEIVLRNASSLEAESDLSRSEQLETGDRDSDDDLEIHTHFPSDLTLLICEYMCLNTFVLYSMFRPLDVWLTNMERYLSPLCTGLTEGRFGRVSLTCETVLRQMVVEYAEHKPEHTYIKRL